MRGFSLGYLLGVFSLGFFFWEGASRAADRGSIPSPPLHLAFQGAGSAALKEGFSYTLNPAALGFQKRSKSALAYTSKNSRQMALLSFMDASSGIPMSLTYSRLWSSQFLKSDESLISAGIGGAVAPWLSMGIAVHRLKEHDRAKPLWNGDAGAIVRLKKNIGLSFAARQLLVNERGNRREGSVGLCLNWENMFQGYADAVRRQEEGSWIFKAAAETIFQKFLALRGGVSLPLTKRFDKSQAVFSGGIAFYGPRLKIDFSAEKSRSGWQRAMAAKLVF